MVFYFQTTGGFKAYMGRDKFENDQLIAHGWPEDIWFHVDKFSSAHVYLRLPRGPERKLFRETGKLDHMPEVVKELCTLTKANSIEGSKQHEVTVSYTPWENLQKRADMVGPRFPCELHAPRIGGTRTPTSYSIVTDKDHALRM